jgi:hypothetical protein
MKRELKKNIFLAAGLVLIAANVLIACTKEKEGGASKLIGEWTSVSATGMITCSCPSNRTLDNELSAAINAHISEYDLSEVMNLDFKKEGLTIHSNYEIGFYMSLWEYTFKENTLRTSNNGGAGGNTFEISLQGDELFMDNIGLFAADFETYIAHAICDMEVRKRGFASAKAVGVSLSMVNLVVKFKRI